MAGFQTYGAVERYFTMEIPSINSTPFSKILPILLTIYLIILMGVSYLIVSLLSRLVKVRLSLWLKVILSALLSVIFYFIQYYYAINQVQPFLE